LLAYLLWDGKNKADRSVVTLHNGGETTKQQRCSCSFLIHSLLVLLVLAMVLFLKKGDTSFVIYQRRRRITA
jgi:hypothetical protein